jgi:hypothetical protein
METNQQRPHHGGLLGGQTSTHVSGFGVQRATFADGGLLRRPGQAGEVGWRGPLGKRPEAG